MRSREWYNEVLILPQEFSIEIPDKEADAIHSGMFAQERPGNRDLMLSQLTRQLTTLLPSQMVSSEFPCIKPQKHELNSA